MVDWPEEDSVAEGRAEEDLVVAREGGRVEGILEAVDLEGG